MTTTVPALQELTLAAARAGARAVQDALRSGLVVDVKGADGTDLVTSADRAAERVIREVIAQRRPHDAVEAEEAGTTPGTSGLRWVVDPLDGTVNFSRGSDRYAVSVAVVEDTGALDAPVLAATIVRGTACTAWSVEQGRVVGAVPPGPPRALDGSRDALVGFAVPNSPDARRDAYRRLARIAADVVDLRNTGSTVCDLVAVATGELDAFVTFDPKPWDVAAGVALVHATGGTSGTWHTTSGSLVLVAGRGEVVTTLGSCLV